jgi:hypothetical protein
MNTTITLSELSRFTGTSGYHKNWTGLLYTDGIKYLAEKAECYWLIDAIASYQHKLKRDPDLARFQLWILSVAKEEGERKYPFIKIKNDMGCALTCWRDTPKEGVKPSKVQQIEYTDFPLPEIKLYVVDGILLLPSEY